jgi:guanylate kinase
MEKRLKNAEQEMAQKHLYRHTVLNDRFDEAVECLVKTVTGYGTPPPCKNSGR